MKHPRALSAGRSRRSLLAAVPASLLLITAGGLLSGSAQASQDVQPAQEKKPAPAVGQDQDKGLPPGVGVTEGARIEYAVGSQNHDFGRLTQGAVASHTFQLTVGGTEDLVIKNVKPTCGCTIAQVKVADADGEMQNYVFGDAIPVGSKVELPATLHTKNKYGKANTRINIFSNDPRGTIQLGLTADIEAFFTLTPRFLNFGQLQLGEVQTQQATITTAGNKAVKLDLVEQAQAATGIKTVVEPLNPDEEGRSSRWQVTVTVGPDLLEGNFARALVLQSDVEIPSAGGDEHDDHDGHDHGPGEGHGAEAAGAGDKPRSPEGDNSGQLPPGHTADDGHDHGAETGKSSALHVKQFFQAQITVSAQVVGPFTYAPNYLSMGLVRPGQVVTRTIRIESHDPEYSFAGREVATRLAGLPLPKADGYQEWEQAKYFATVVRPVEGKNAIDVELRLEGLPEDAVGSFRGTLLVELGHKDKPEIALTITGVCRGGPTPGRRVPPRPTGGGL